MADTIRTIQELNAMLSDNTSGSITEQDLRDVLVSMNVHTEIGRAGITGQMTTTWTKLPLNTAGAFERGFMADTANNQIANTPVDLKAKITIEVHLATAPPAGQSFHFGAFVNGVLVPRTQRSFTTAGHYTWTIGVQLSEGDTIDLRAMSDSTRTVTLNIAVLRAERVGIE